MTRGRRGLGAKGKSTRKGPPRRKPSPAHAPAPQGRKKGKQAPAKTARGERPSGMRGPEPERTRPSLPPRRPEQDAELTRAQARPRAPSLGHWLWTTRQGSERDCLEELLQTSDCRASAHLVAPSLVASTHALRDDQQRLSLTFARQGFEVIALSSNADDAALAAEFAAAILKQLQGEAFGLHVFVPDSEQGNPLARRADTLESLIVQALAAARPDVQRLDDMGLRRGDAVPLVQVCLLDATSAALGITPSDLALSLWPGGRARMRLSKERPSRAARKLEEAFAWLGAAPGPGELCVDLGAAPGGWSWLVLGRGARVIAVDPARMAPELMQQRRLRHVQQSAFPWHPDEPVDWLLCDMAWRPTEVAQMLGRWGRLRNTRMLVANFKLPMKRKAETASLLRELLTESGYRDVRTRQLYHDREEITLTART